MATKNIVPRIVCDCCGFDTEKKQTHSGFTQPSEWGSLKIPPAHWGNYPDHISFQDVCPDCIRKIHKSVSDTIDQIHRSTK